MKYVYIHYIWQTFIGLIISVIFSFSVSYINGYSWDVLLPSFLIVFLLGVTSATALFKDEIKRRNEYG